MKRLRSGLAPTGFSLLAGAVAHAYPQTQYILDNGSVDAGTQTVQAVVPGSGGARKYELSGSIGQPDAGCLLGESAQIVAGFMGAFACESYGDLAPPFCVVELADVNCMVDGYRDPNLCFGSDIAPCGGDGIVELSDVLAILDAYAGIYLCPHECSP